MRGDTSTALYAFIASLIFAFLHCEFYGNVCCAYKLRGSDPSARLAVHQGSRVKTLSVSVNLTF